LYTSLLKVWEKEAARVGEMDALCKGMGRPGMHIRGKVGFSIDYWKARRMLKTNEKRREDVAGKEDGKYWRVIVEVEDVRNDDYITPVRTSEDWVSDNIMKSR